jgi:hypothetical protein
MRDPMAVSFAMLMLSSAEYALVSWSAGFDSTQYGVRDSSVDFVLRVLQLCNYGKDFRLCCKPFDPSASDAA